MVEIKVARFQLFKMSLVTDDLDIGIGHKTITGMPLDIAAVAFLKQSGCWFYGIYGH